MLVQSQLNWSHAYHIIGTGEENRGMSPEMAGRLSKVFGGSAESWLVQSVSTG